MAVAAALADALMAAPCASNSIGIKRSGGGDFNWGVVTDEPKCVGWIRLARLGHTDALQEYRGGPGCHDLLLRSRAVASKHGEPGER